MYRDGDSEAKPKARELASKHGIRRNITLGHAHVAGRSTHMLKKHIHGRVEFTEGAWGYMLKGAH